MRQPPSRGFLRWLRAELELRAAPLMEEGKLRNEMADSIGASWRKQLLREGRDLKAEAVRLRTLVDRCGKPCAGSCEACARGAWTITRGSASADADPANPGPRETYFSDEISGEFEARA